jgi:hypothetical protein
VLHIPGSGLNQTKNRQGNNSLMTMAETKSAYLKTNRIEKQKAKKRCTGVNIFDFPFTQATGIKVG